MCTKISQMKHKIAILASGSGSNAENIFNYFSEIKSSIEISLIITNKSDAFVLKRAEKLNIPAVVISGKDMKDESLVTELLKKYEIDFIVLAGYLLKIPEFLIRMYNNKIVNIHPALLPSYGGKGMYGDNVHKAVVEAGEKESGITIHYVNENYDEGKIIFQAKCEVLPGDTYEDVASKVHKLEYEYFPKVIAEVLSK